MNEWELLKLAKRGQLRAISVLLNRTVVDQGITVKINLKEGCLRILLEAPQVPDQVGSIALIQQQILRLKSDFIQSAHIYGRQLGMAKPAWSQIFEFESISPLDRAQ
jgi:hypothetical protein